MKTDFNSVIKWSTLELELKKILKHNLFEMTVAVSFPLSDIILAQLACLLNAIIFVDIGNH
jgi:hypothetical protein